MIFIIKGFRTIVFVFIVISTTFRPICHPAFFRCLSNSGTFTELRTTSFIESTPYVQKDTWRNGYRRWSPKLLRRQSSGGCRFNPDLLASNNTGILNTFIRLWQTESEQATPVDSMKDVVRSSVKVPVFDKHLKKAGGHISRNVVGIIKMKTIVRKPLMIKTWYSVASYLFFL